MRQQVLDISHSHRGQFLREDLQFLCQRCSHQHLWLNQEDLLWIHWVCLNERGCLPRMPGLRSLFLSRIMIMHQLNLRMMRRSLPWALARARSAAKASNANKAFMVVVIFSFLVWNFYLKENPIYLNSSDESGLEAVLINFSERIWMSLSPTKSFFFFFLM